MEKKLFIKEIKDNESISDFFLVADKKINIAKNDTSYLFLLLKDKSGSIEAKKWDIKDKKFEEISLGDVVNIKGRAEKFKDKIQIIIEEISKVEKTENLLNDLIPTSQKNLAKLSNKLIEFINEIKDKNLKSLIEKIFFDNNEEIFKIFKISPASTKFHHAYRGGLLEHTINVTEISVSLGKIYNTNNIDLLIAGSILHDIGKVYEYDPITFKKTDKGRFLGHIAIGIEIISKKIERLRNFPENYSNSLKHIILSHHGEFEWGSPVQPAFLEALIIHYADLIDSKVNPIVENVTTEEGWKYLKSLRRNFVNIEYFKDDNEDDVLLKEKQLTKKIFE